MWYFVCLIHTQGVEMTVPGFKNKEYFGQDCPPSQTNTRARNVIRDNPNSYESSAVTMQIFHTPDVSICQPNTAHSTCVGPVYWSLLEEDPTPSLSST